MFKFRLVILSLRWCCRYENFKMHKTFKKPISLKAQMIYNIFRCLKLHKLYLTDAPCDVYEIKRNTKSSKPVDTNACFAKENARWVFFCVVIQVKLLLDIGNIILFPIFRYWYAINKYLDISSYTMQRYSTF